jgi:hypothetical protein
LEDGIKFDGLRDIGGDCDTIRANLFLSVTDGPLTAPDHDDCGALLDVCAMSAFRPIATK